MTDWDCRKNSDGQSKIFCSTPEHRMNATAGSDHLWQAGRNYEQMKVLQTADFLKLKTKLMEECIPRNLL